MNMAINMKDLKSFSTWNALLAEATGVLVLVLIGAGTIAVTGTLEGGLSSARLAVIALSLGLTYVAMVAMTYRVSGGHINPAVTFTAVATGRMGIAKGMFYVMFQLAGAVGGSLDPYSGGSSREFSAVNPFDSRSSRNLPGGRGGT